MEIFRDGQGLQKTGKELFQHINQNAGGNGAADNARHIRTHGMHQQEILRIFLLAHLLGNTRRHRNGGNAGRTDQRVHLAVRGPAHNLAQQNTACRAKAKCHNAHHNNLDCIPVQERFRIGRAAHRNAQKDRDDIHQLIAGRFVDALYNAGFLHQVAEHQHAHQRHSCRQNQADNNGADDREHDIL